MKPLGLGIIGLHHQHPRWYHPLWTHLPEYRLVAVAERDGEFLARENAFFGLDAHEDYHELLGRGDIDVVCIWLPHSEMPDAVEAAVRAGKHVIVEKPCGADLAGVRRVVEAAKAADGVHLSAPFCWRNHPVSAHVKAAADGGLFGAITAMHARLNAGTAMRYVRDNAGWMLRSAEGGGPMWNLGVHWIDYFRWLTGAEVVSVTGAVSGPCGEPERDIEDNAQAVLTFDNGAVATLDISYSLPSYYPGSRDIHLGIRGTLGDVAWSPSWKGNVDEVLLVSGHPDAEDRCRRLRVKSLDIAGYGGEMGWRWLKNFADAVIAGSPPEVTPDDILASVEAADAFYRSVGSGRREPVGKPGGSAA